MFQIGDKVYHKIFKNGVITNNSVKNDFQIIQVKFDKYGIKDLHSIIVGDQMVIIEKGEPLVVDQYEEWED